MPPKYEQHYREEWEKMSEFKQWLTRAKEDSTKAYCKYCKCDIIAKISCLKQHIVTSKHAKHVAPKKSQKKIDFPKVHIQLVTQKAECSLALFISEHASTLTVDHLSEMCKKTFSDSRSADIKLHRTKCTNIIKFALAPHFISQLVADIGHNKFSILVDESTDISVTKILGTSIRYYDSSHKNIITTFLGLVEIENGTADAIVNGLKTLFAELKLNMKNLIGIGTDNASSMTGVNNGVHSLLKTETGNENLVLVRCLCHSLQLAITHASEKSLPRNIEFLIRETYNWFSHSSNRQLFYKELYKTINCGKEPLKITQVCSTRWLSIEPAVRRVIDQWLELKSHFEIVKQKENCYMAEMLYSMYNDPVNHLYLLYLLPILDEVQRVNKNFESNDRDPTKLLNDLVELVESVARRIILPTAQIDVLTATNLESYLDPSPYMGYGFELKLTEYELLPEAERNLRHRCKQFTLKLIQEMRSRLPTNITILRTMSMLSVQETLKAIKPPIIKLAQEFGCQANEIERIVVQWMNIRHTDWENKCSTVEFWSEVYGYKDSADNNPFSELASLAISILSLPHSNAEIERVFSQMNIVKTKLRNRMSLHTLNSILHIRYGLKRSGKCCHSYNVPENVLKQIRGIKESLVMPMTIAIEDGPSTSQAQAHDEADYLIYIDD